MLKPGDPAPTFDLACAFDGKISHVALAGLQSEMVVVFFYPRDFSFICPTEVVGFHKSYPAFQAERTSVVGISVDDAESHLRWAAELGGLSYPLLADTDAIVTRGFGVFDEAERVAIRATFILDQARKVCCASATSINVGRSVAETLRIVRALRCGRQCPADWQPGSESAPIDLEH
jgi:peroxiredoxin (alkyl hydroperoxide reductase subunit C)